MINEERFKLVPNEKPEYKNSYAGHYVIESWGYGPCASQYKHIKEFYGEDPLDDVDIAPISYFTTRAMYHETEDKFFGDLQWNKYNNRITNEDIYAGPLAFILPYLYDDDYGMGIIDRGWDYIQDIKIYKHDENEDKFVNSLKKINQWKKSSVTSDVFFQIYSKIHANFLSGENRFLNFTKNVKNRIKNTKIVNK